MDDSVERFDTLGAEVIYSLSFLPIVIQLRYCSNTCAPLANLFINQNIEHCQTKMSRLSDKVAIVTASSSGIGRAIALAFASQGTKLVVCADLQPTARPGIAEEAAAKATHELIQEQHGNERAIFIKTDALVESEVEACVKEAIDKGKRIDM